jgi:xanthine dehydrogenase/oxidase
MKEQSNTLNFYINGNSHTIVNPDPTLLLVDYLRSPEVGLTGTKFGCGEGGCAACTVVETKIDPLTDEIWERPVNSCLRPIVTLDGVSITTTEGIGSLENGVNPVQERIAAFNGSQCGYCTPGFVMNMYSFLRENDNPSSEEIESRFDGHICRCTGFRSILNAMQSFQGDASAIQEAAQGPIPREWLAPPRPLHFSGSGQDYYKVTTLDEVFEIMLKHKVTPDDVKLVNGNTSVGIYKKAVYFPKLLIDISQVRELFEKELKEDGIHLGGGRAMQDLLELTEQALALPEHSSDAGFIALNKHVHRIAGTQVRSVASVAGNIMLVKNHEFEGDPFPSDLFTCLVTLGGKITLVTPDGSGPKTYTGLEMPPVNSFDHGFVIKKIFIPFTQADTLIKTYKVSRRFQNAHAVINAGFRFEVQNDVIVKAIMVFGGVSRIAIRASETERSIEGLKWTMATFSNALKVLDQEIESRMIAMEDEGISEAFRRSLAVGIFQKYGIYLADSTNAGFLDSKDKSGGSSYIRPVSSGHEGYIEAPYNDADTMTSRVVSRDATSSMLAGAASEKLFTPIVQLRKIKAESLKLTAKSLEKENDLIKNPDNVNEGQGRVKISALIQATGEAKYTQDLAGPPNTLHASFVFSTAQFAKFSYKYAGLSGLQKKLKEEYPAAIKYISVEDINQAGKGSGFFKNNNVFDIGNCDFVWANYDPVFANEYVTAYGQPIGVVVAQDLYTSRDAAAWLMEQIEYDHIEEGKASTIEEALKLPPNQGQLPYAATNLGLSKMIRPSSDMDWIDTPKRIEGKVNAYGRQLTGAQYHFYMETHATLAVPTENNSLKLFSSTQHLASVQQKVADILGLQNNRVEAEVIRLGGGFGGKEVRPPYPAMAAAIAAWTLNKPVRLANDRNTDMIMQGTRHSFQGDYHVVADQSGVIEKLKLDYVSNAGYSFDCSQPVMDLVLLSADGAYNIPTFGATGISCRTNIVSRTAFRSFGIIQCRLIAEEAMEHIAHKLGIRPEVVRERNFYRDASATEYDYTPYGQALKYCRVKQVWDDLKDSSDFDARLLEVEAYNKNNRWRKKGISMIPIKYGISYTYRPMNQGGAYVVVFSADGTVTIEHGGIEMGQGIHTKITEIAASILGIDVSLIRIGISDTSTVPNASSTGASTGTDLNGGAVKMACQDIKDRLIEFCKANPDNEKLKGWETKWTKMWPTIVEQAYSARVNLAAQALYSSPDLGTLTEEPLASGNWELVDGDQAFYYFNYCAAVSEVEIDVLTGDCNILRSDLIYDAGRSTNPIIDFGQIEGGFVQGIGNVTTEEIYYAEDGRLIPYGTWNYKPPASKTIPVEFNVFLLNYVRNDHKTETPMDHYGIQSSKSTGEPPLVLANTVFFAIKHAILSARQDTGFDEWFELESPATVERIQMACLPHLPRIDR